MTRTARPAFISRTDRRSLKPRASPEETALIGVSLAIFDFLSNCFEQVTGNAVVDNPNTASLARAGARPTNLATTAALGNDVARLFQPLFLGPQLIGVSDECRSLRQRVHGRSIRQRRIACETGYSSKEGLVARMTRALVKTSSDCGSARQHFGRRQAIAEPAAGSAVLQAVSLETRVSEPQAAGRAECGIG